MRKSVKQARSIVGTSPGRPKHDFYPTPTRAIEALLSVETFPDPILEPACGDGAISKVLVEHFYEVTSSDLIYRGFGNKGSIDFLGEYYKTWNGSIITNPPFRFAQQFAEKSLALGCKKLALLCKLQFLEGIKRTEFLMGSPLKKTWVFRKRLKLCRNGNEQSIKGGGMMAFAWFIWEYDYVGNPTIGWL